MSPFLRLSALVLGLLLGLASPLVAAQDEIVVPAEGQQPAQREQALRQALSRYLVQLTGREDAPAQLADWLSNPGRFVQRYRYEHGPEGLRLAVQFDAPAVRRALAERGVAVWDVSRPPVLVWMAVERGGQRLLVSPDETPVLRNQLLDAARARGVPLLFPLMDAEDRAKVSFADVWGGFSDRLRVAAGRYGTPVVLIGRAFQDRGEWVSRWQLLGAGPDSAWSGAAATLEQALERGMAELAPRLAGSYTTVAAAAADPAGLRLRVEEVRDLASLGRLTRYLRSVAGVTSLQPVLVEPAAVVLRIETDVDPQRILRQLDGQGTLTPIRDAGPPQAEYRYRLLP